jgi:hypothetical protein
MTGRDIGVDTRSGHAWPKKRLVMLPAQRQPSLERGISAGLPTAEGG